MASEVHTRTLASLGAPGDFRGLFADGACAFVLGLAETPSKDPVIGEFISGCSGSEASALEATLSPDKSFEFRFRGEALGRAAIGRLLRVVEKLERLSGRSRSELAMLAIHEPNPRLAAIFARNAQLSESKLPMVSRAYGNLGSATCGVGLCLALDRLEKDAAGSRPLIFVAAVAPGLLWSGTYFH